MTTANISLPAQAGANRRVGAEDLKIGRKIGALPSWSAARPNQIWRGQQIQKHEKGTNRVSRRPTASYRRDARYPGDVLPRGVGVRERSDSGLVFMQTGGARCSSFARIRTPAKHEVRGGRAGGSATQ